MATRTRCRDYYRSRSRSESGRRRPGQWRKAGGAEFSCLIYDGAIFVNVAAFPVGENVRDAAILFDSHDVDFANELAIARNEHVAAGQDAIVGADVQDDETELRVDIKNLAFEARRFNDSFADADEILVFAFP